MKRAGCLPVLVSCLLVAQAAHAASRDAHEPLVLLTEQGSRDAEDVAFISSARALAAEIGIVVSTEEVPTFQAVRDALLAEARGQRKPFLVAWILREDSLRIMHLFDPWNNQLRTRTIDAGVSATANAEALALILRAELLAYLHEPPPPSPPMPPAQAPPSPPAQKSQSAIMASYALSTFLRGQGLQQGARLGFEHRWLHLRLGLSYGLFPRQDVAGQDVAITVRRHALALGVGYVSREYHRLRWAAETSLGGDYVSRHTSRAESPLSLHSDAGHLVVSLGARACQELRLFGNLAFVLALGMGLPLNPIEFQIARGTTTETVARLSPVRFGAELGIKVSVF